MTFDDYVVDFGDVSVARKKDKSVRERSISELFAEAEKPEVSEKDARAFKAEAHRRLLAPWFNLVFALLACTGLLISNFNPPGAGESYYGFYFGNDTGAGAGYDVCEYGAPVRVDCGADVC